MIQKLATPCFVFDPSPHEYDVHFLDVEAAGRALHSYLEDIRRDDDPDQLRLAERLVIVQNSEPCGLLTCDGCGDEYENEEFDVHLLSVEDDQAAIEAAVADGWTRGPGDTIHCADCPALNDPAPGPTEYDVPLPLSGAAVPTQGAV